MAKHKKVVVVPQAPQRKAAIPKALREQVWIQGMGRVFEGKCRTTWCTNQITVFDFQCGHNVPESKGGATDLRNLVPICGRCNLSMGSQYTFDQWCVQFVATVPPSPIHLSVSPVPPPTRPTCWQTVVRFFCGFNRNGQNTEAAQAAA
jgi:hypothetical protein